MNSLVPSQPTVGTRQGDWMWDGSNWICCPDTDPCPPVPFPPFGPPVFSGPTQQPPWYPGANGGVSFGTTFPSNVVRGHLFWDGKTFWLFDGAAWVSVGGAAGGAITPPGTTFPSNPVPGQQFFNGTTLFVWDGNAWVPVAGTKTTISATAPASPAAGDLWFDGTQLRIWDGSAWQLVGPGATVGPVPTTTKVFSLTMAADITIPTGNPSIVPFVSTPTIDTMSGWDPVTHKWMPKKNGMYLFVTRNRMSPAQSYAGHWLLANDNGVWNSTSQLFVTAAGLATTSSLDDYMIGVGVARLNGTTDFVRLWGQASDGTFHLLSSVMPVIDAWLLP